MGTAELLNLFRIEMHDTEAPYLFRDEVIAAYINDAQRQFCRLTEGIEDGRSFSLSIVPGTEWYALDKRVLKLRSVYDQATGRPVTIVPAERMEDNCMRFDGRNGPLRALVSGLEKGMLRTWPGTTGTDASTLVLSVFRLPLPVELGDELEVDEQHHLHLLMWVKHLAYGNQDLEVFNRNKSGDFEMQFRAYCAKAKAEQGRARHPAGTVQYQGY